MSIKKIIEKITGIDKIKEEIADSLKLAHEAEEAKKQAEAAAKAAAEAADAAIRESKKTIDQSIKAAMSPKERATAENRPWVSVLETHVNEKDPKNGFFDLDWNDEFIRYLRLNGYQGQTQEEIVDKWFTDLCRTVATEQNVDMSRRGSGQVQRALREDGLSEFS